MRHGSAAHGFRVRPTYGIAATPVYNRYVGHTYAFAMALGTIAFSQAHQGGVEIHPGYWGSYPCCGSASANVYRYWGRTAYSKSRAKGAGGGRKAARQAAAKPAPAPAPAPATGQPIVPTNASALAPPPMLPARAAAVTGANRGYDMTMVTTADSGNPGPVVTGSNAPPTPVYISANAYYASIGEDAATAPTLTPANVYADASGNVYRHDGNAWQQQTASGWTSAPAAPAGADDEMQAQDRATQVAMQAGSYSMSNTTRFTGERGDGWTRRDSGRRRLQPYARRRRRHQRRIQRVQRRRAEQRVRHRDERRLVGPDDLRGWHRVGRPLRSVAIGGRFAAMRSIVPPDGEPARVPRAAPGAFAHTWEPVNGMTHRCRHVRLRAGRALCKRARPDCV